MAEITTGAPIQPPTPVSTPAPAPTAPAAAPTTLQKVENTIFAFMQAHYAKLLAAIVGFATSHFGLLGKFF
jgi:hypothetical protein